MKTRRVGIVVSEFLRVVGPVLNYVYVMYILQVNKLRIIVIVNKKKVT